MSQIAPLPHECYVAVPCSYVCTKQFAGYICGEARFAENGKTINQLRFFPNTLETLGQNVPNRKDSGLRTLRKYLKERKLELAITDSYVNDTMAIVDLSGATSTPFSRARCVRVVSGGANAARSILYLATKLKTSFEIRHNYCIEQVTADLRVAEEKWEEVSLLCAAKQQALIAPPLGLFTPPTVQPEQACLIAEPQEPAMPEERPEPLRAGEPAEACIPDCHDSPDLISGGGPRMSSPFYTFPPVEPAVEILSSSYQGPEYQHAHSIESSQAVQEPLPRRDLGRPAKRTREDSLEGDLLISEAVDRLLMGPQGTPHQDVVEDALDDTGSLDLVNTWLRSPSPAPAENRVQLGNSSDAQAMENSLEDSLTVIMPSQSSTMNGLDAEWMTPEQELMCPMPPPVVWDYDPEVHFSRLSINYTRAQARLSELSEQNLEAHMLYQVEHEANVRAQEKLADLQSRHENLVHQLDYISKAARGGEAPPRV